MTLDERVVRILDEMTEDLIPAPDPYGRVRARYRRRQRRRMVLAGLGVVAALLVGAVPFLRADRGAAPDVAAAPARDPRLAWAQRMADSPPRGAVARDTSYLSDLAARLLVNQHRGYYEPKMDVVDVRVLFVDDLGAHRVALAVFRQARAEPDLSPYLSVWLVDHKGASAERLARPEATNQTHMGLEPVESIGIGLRDGPANATFLYLVPRGCEFATAALPAASDWRPEPTGSYLIRRPETTRPEWWRITCDGVVRELGPGLGSPADHGVSDAYAQSARIGARGEVNAALVRDALVEAAQMWGYGVATLPTVVWGGRTTGARPNEGTAREGAATVVAAAAVADGWWGAVCIRFDRPIGTDTGTIVPFRTPDDPRDPAAVLAIELGRAGSTLVITPTAARTVLAVRDGQVLAQAPVRAAGAMLTAPLPDRVVFQALDRDGAVLGTTARATAGNAIATVTHWDED
jgi:hypothetical protein